MEIKRKGGRQGRNEKREFQICTARRETSQKKESDRATGKTY